VVTEQAVIEEAEKDQISGEHLQITVEANDRPGIVEEIANALSSQNTNIIKMETRCESASMAGYQMFQAYMLVELPVGYAVDQLEETLESVSDDLVVNVTVE
jgi:glycine cleavage system regulatory protein